MAIDGHRKMSKTQHYRKVTKPLLERKRRARMNQYLDELKSLIVETMESKGEHITKLEKADILELTVNYLKDKQRSVRPFIPPADPINKEKFYAGYTQAAFEVSKMFSSIPGLDAQFGTKLMKHLGSRLTNYNMPRPSLSERESVIVTATNNNNNNNIEPMKTYSYSDHHFDDRKPSNKTIGNNKNGSYEDDSMDSKDVWRPW